MKAEISAYALSVGYPQEAVDAATEHLRRRDRKSHPPGKFDSAGRFYAAERTASVENAREPSRQWPLSEMKSARTAAHCAEVFEAKALHVKRLAKSFDGIPDGGATNHAQIDWMNQVRRILKPV